MRDLKTAPVLYIDDLFKGAERPTQGDLNIAFELLNYRYNDERLYTIISTEKLLDELIAIDEAIGSRIAERSKGHRVQINRDPALELEDTMIGQQIRLAFVGVPPSMNQFNGRKLKNVQVYRAVKADWTDRVTWQARARRPKRPFERAEVLIEYQFQDNRRRDPDNYSGKFILDGLTKGGIIRDDSFQHISLTVRAKPTPGPAETTITIREVLDDERPEIR